MTEKRFRVQEHCLRSSYGIEAENWLVTNDNHSVVLNDKAEAHMVANMCNDVIDVLNHFAEENKHLKQALLFFLDVANSQCSSSFGKDMEHDCQKLFNCSYSEAKDKYGGYDATWWELGE